MYVVLRNIPGRNSVGSPSLNNKMLVSRIVLTCHFETSNCVLLVCVIQALYETFILVLLIEKGVLTGRYDRKYKFHENDE